MLAPQPTNRFDSNAVAVQVDGNVVGYLPRELAAEYQSGLLAMLQRGEYGWCPGRIMGGRRKSYGIWLHLAPAGPNLLFANDFTGIELLDADHMVTVSGFDPITLPYPLRADSRLPTLTGTLSVGQVAKGKYAGQPCLEVLVDGRRIGALTAKMTERYMPFVRPVIGRGLLPGCEVIRLRHDGKLKLWAQMPKA